MSLGLFDQLILQNFLHVVHSICLSNHLKLLIMTDRA